MAFTDEQKEKIREYLGFSAGWRDRNHQIESMFDLVGDSGVRQASVEKILDELDTAEETVASAASASDTRGALKRVEELEWHSPKDSESSGSSPMTAREYGTLLIQRLGRRFGFRPGGFDDGYFKATRPSGGELRMG